MILRRLFDITSIVYFAVIILVGITLGIAYMTFNED